MAWAISIVVFTFLFFVLTQVFGGFFGFIIAGGAVFCLFFFYLDKRAFGIVCPHCQKYIETNTPWICGYKQCRNENVDDFPFIYRCQHCGAEPKAYQCHHLDCQKLIFFTKDEQKINFAKCVNVSDRPKPVKIIKDKDADEMAKLDKGIQLTERMVKKAKLDLELKGVKENLKPVKEMTQEEILSKSAQEFVDRNMSGPKIVERLKAKNAEIFKDNPDELKKQNLLVDQWATNHLGHM